MSKSRVRKLALEFGLILLFSAVAGSVLFAVIAAAVQLTGLFGAFGLLLSLMMGGPIVASMGIAFMFVLFRHEAIDEFTLRHKARSAWLR